MNVRVSAENAGWTLREAAWNFEERVLWRGEDVSRVAVERINTTIAPLQRLIQTRLTWPLSDVLRKRSARTRAAFAASAAVLALAAAGAGAMTAPHDSNSDSPPATVAAAATPLSTHTASGAPVLQGVTPTFQHAKAKADAPAPAPQPPSESSAPPSQVAWQFAQAFVGYEVGRPGKEVDSVFATTATKQLAKALASDPPRLPSKAKVPRARVLNVVLGAHAKNQVTASVSLVRLRAVSELRLTLNKTGEAWRVAQVLG
jgi:hypothetical protein